MVLPSMGYSEAEYEEMKKRMNFSIDHFDAIKFKTELEKYLKIYTDETLVFIFDEASEAVSLGKISLLDLEGISEALSSISSKVWTVSNCPRKTGRCD